MSMDKIQFQSNDIVRLSKKKFEILSRELFFPQNLFVVKDINIGADSILLNNINQKFSLEDIRPVRIDGEEDRDIYYDPIVAASLINIGEDIPVVHRDTSEYDMDALKKSYNEHHESYYDEIHYIGARYVHEIQNKIPLLRYDLKIHYHIMEFVNKSNVLGRLGKIEKVLTAKEYNDTFIKKTIEDEETIVYLKKDIDERTQIASLYNKQDFDYVALSFVQTAGDIIDLRSRLVELGSKAHVVAKVETKSAISPENLEEIVRVSDGIMVARGDLAVEAGAVEMI